MNGLQDKLISEGVQIDKVNKYSIKTTPSNEEVSAIIENYAKDFKKKNGYSFTLAKKESTKMAEAKDAYTLSSGTKMEAKYAEYANKMKALANEGRKLRVSLKNTKYDKDAKAKYSKEVSSIMAKINEAMKRKPLERKVQAMADVKISLLMQEHPDFDKQDRKKHRARIVRELRQRMGTQKTRPVLTESEWDAVKAGALTSTTINNLFSLMDVDVVREYATPKNYESKLSKSEIAYAKALVSRDAYTTADIADLLGVSVSTLNRALNQ